MQNEDRWLDILGWVMIAIVITGWIGFAQCTREAISQIPEWCEDGCIFTSE
jgi:hypothetical protein